MVPCTHSVSVAPVVQLVTSKPSDVGTDVSSNLGAITRTGNKWRTINSWVHKIRLHGSTRERNG